MQCKRDIKYLDKYLEIKLKLLTENASIRTCLNSDLNPCSQHWMSDFRYEVETKGTRI